MSNSQHHPASCASHEPGFESSKARNIPLHFHYKTAGMEMGMEMERWRDGEMEMKRWRDGERDSLLHFTVFLREVLDIKWPNDFIQYDGIRYSSGLNSITNTIL